MQTRILLFVAIAVVYLLHQDVWFWNTARPLVFGILPIGLAYHTAYCLLAAAMMWVLTKTAWPAHLDDREERSGAKGPRERRAWRGAGDPAR